MVRMKAFRAVDDLESCLKYAEGHEQVLKSYGVPKVTSANTDWIYNPNVIVILIESLFGYKLLGGVKIHVAGGTQPLPIEEALGDADEKIYKMIKKYTLNGTGELCGLWNAKEVAGYGYNILLTRAAAALGNNDNNNGFQIKSLFILCAPWTVELAKNVGFVVEKKLGNVGTFWYPKPDLLASVLMIKDTEKLEHADPKERNMIFDLRMNPRQIKTDLLHKRELEIEYDLIISSRKHRTSV